MTENKIEDDLIKIKVEKYSNEINKLSVMELLIVVNYIVFGVPGGDTSRQVLAQENIANMVNDILNYNEYRLPASILQAICFKFLEGFFKEHPDKEKTLRGLHKEYKMYPEGLMNGKEYRELQRRRNDHLEEVAKLLYHMVT